MPWVKLDDQFPENKKVDPLSDGAFRLHVSGLCWSAKQLTDGFIPDDRVARLMPRYKAGYLRELVSSAPEGNPLWTAATGGYLIHDFVEFQKDAKWWKDKREKDARRLADWRAKRDAEREE